MATIQERGASFRVLWRLGGSRDGGSQSATFGDKKTAQRFADEAKRQGHNVTAADLHEQMFGRTENRAAPTVAEWVGNYVESIADVITAGTRAEYERTIWLHLKPSPLGRTSLPAANRETVQRWIGELIRRPLAPKSVANHYAVIAAAMQAAVDQGVIPGNPCRGVTLPRADVATHELGVFLTAQEVETLVGAMSERLKPLVVLLARTGLRWGEATALQVADINPLGKPPTLRVERAWQRAPVGRELGPPKTRAGRRTVSLDDATVDAVLPLLAGRQGREWLFTARDGLSPLPRTTFREAWLRATTVLGKPVRIHDLRHTHASWLLESGTPMQVVMRRLGHTSIKVTVDTYGHRSPDADEAVLATLNGLGRSAAVIASRS
jgi:integrase